MANYSSTSLHVLTAADDFNTETTLFQNQANVPADEYFSFTNGTVRIGNFSLNLSPPIPGSDSTARRTWLTGKRPATGQAYPRGVFNK